MEPISLIIGLISIFATLAISARNRQDQKEANTQVMDFNAEEAEKSRDWQEEQYKKYESVAAQMQQRQQAGLNPFENIASMSVGSGATASSSANSISPMSTPDFSIFGQLAKDFADAEGQNLDNDLFKETYDKRKEQFDEQVRSLKISNDREEFWNKMFESAYTNADGTINEDLNPIKNEAKQKKAEAQKAAFEADVAEFRKQIEEQNKYSAEFKTWTKKVLGLDLDILPSHLRHEVTLYTYDLFAGGFDSVNKSTEYFKSLFAEIEQWYKEEKAIHTDSADGISTTVKDIEYALNFLSNNSAEAREALKQFFFDVGEKYVELQLKSREWWINNVDVDTETWF